MNVVCAQPPTLGSMSRGWRLAVFSVGMMEAMLWSGTIYGWASLVHVLKLQGVYRNLCLVGHTEHIDIDSTPGSLNATVSTQPGLNNVSPSSICLLKG